MTHWLGRLFWLFGLSGLVLCLVVYYLVRAVTG